MEVNRNNTSQGISGHTLPLAINKGGAISGFDCILVHKRASARRSTVLQFCSSTVLQPANFQLIKHFIFR
jgi:hypothetical protein